MSSSFTYGIRPIRLARLESQPTHANLLQLLATAMNDPDRHIIVQWPSSQPDEFNYFLSVFVSMPGQTVRKGWNTTVQMTEVGEPEWCMFRESEPRKELTEVWSVKMGDLALLLNLISTEVMGSNEETVESAESVLLTNSNSFWQKDPSRQSQVYMPAMQPLSDSQQLRPLSSDFRPQSQSPVVTHERMLVDPNLAGVLLSGSLKELNLSSVMQSIDLCRMTGRLNLSDNLYQVEVYFTDGELVHAQCNHAIDTNLSSVGESVILDILIWDDGTFQFQRGWKAPTQSITKRLHSLLLEGAMLSDYRAALTKAGVVPSSFLSKTNPTLTEKELDEKLDAGLPIQRVLQKKILAALNSPMSLDDLLTAIPNMSKSVWIPIIFNLMSRGLITISGTKSLVDELSFVSFGSLPDLISDAYRSLLQPESGMFGYSMFLVFAERELSRVGQGMCSIAYLEMDARGRQISREALWEISVCFEAVRQPLDILAYSVPNQLFILMPQTALMEGQRRIAEFIDVISRNALDRNLQGHELTVTYGLAGTPDDRPDLVTLLQVAHRHWRKSTQAETPIIGPLSA